MDSSDLVLCLVVATALGFDFTNGFHDTANAMATSIATRALRPRVAVLLAAALNFIGAFISLQVAATIAEDIVDPHRRPGHRHTGPLVVSCLGAAAAAALFVQAQRSERVTARDV